MLPQSQYQQPTPTTNSAQTQSTQMFTALAQTVTTSNGQSVQRVTVVDINMSFGSMVVFMIKWALAAIPALIILFILGFVASIIFSAFFAALFGLFR
jgi:hypothetical protein